MAEEFVPQVVRRQLPGARGERPRRALRLVGESHADRVAAAENRRERAREEAAQAFALRRHGREQRRKAKREAQAPAWKRQAVAGRGETVEAIEARWRAEREAKDRGEQLELF